MPDSVNHFFMSFIVKLEHKSSWNALYSVTISFIFTVEKLIHKAVSTYIWPSSRAYLCAVVQYVDVSFQLFAVCVRVLAAAAPDSMSCLFMQKHRINEL